jgi:putative transport protein
LAATTVLLLILCLVIAAGSLLGKGSVGGLSLGSSAILFAALVAGHLGARIPDQVGTIGMVLFVYSVGISAGPTFFRVFAREGRILALLGAILVGTGGLTTWVMARLFSLPGDLACGMFAGAMTSTPALGALTESFPADSRVAVGFGIAYPIGVCAVVAFVQLLPRFLGETPADQQADSDGDAKAVEIVRSLVEVCNPAVVGKRPSSVAAIANSGCQVSRLLRDDRLQPIDSGFAFALGQRVLVVGGAAEIEAVTETLGHKIAEFDLSLDVERQRKSVVVTSDKMVGSSLRQLQLLSRYGVTITRIRRHDFEFVPTADTVIEYADALSAVGQPERLATFSAFAGHRPTTIDQTDLTSLAIGLAAGIVVGGIRFEVLGESASLGLAGGPLLVGLVLGHFGRIGPIVGHFPRAARILMTDAGLALFLAAAGIEAGGSFLEVVRVQGIALCAASLLIALVPLSLGILLGRRVWHMSVLRISGAVSGAMTSTPGLAAITSRTDSSVPVVSYVAAYPVALCVITVLSPVLARLLA